MFLYRTKMTEWEDSVKSVRALQVAAFKSKLTVQKDDMNNGKWGRQYVSGVW